MAHIINDTTRRRVEIRGLKWIQGGKACTFEIPGGLGTDEFASMHLLEEDDGVTTHIILTNENGSRYEASPRVRRGQGRPGPIPPAQVSAPPQPRRRVRRTTTGVRPTDGKQDVFQTGEIVVWHKSENGRSTVTRVKQSGGHYEIDDNDLEDVD